MPSLHSADPALLGTVLQGLSQPVTMHYYTPDVDSWYSCAERQLLSEIAHAAPSITLDIHPDRWDAARAARLGIARTPAIALYGPQHQDTGIRYYGMPDGYELETFLHTLRAVATGTPMLQPATLTHVRQLTRPVHLEVVVSPT